MRIRIRLLALAALALSWLVPGLLVAQEGPGPVDVIELEGPVDVTAVRFAMQAIRQAAVGGSQLVVIQVDAPAALTPEVEELIALVKDPPIPVAVWVGPSPAVAHGGSAQLVAATPLRAVAPGSRIGYLAPTVAGDRGEDPGVVRARFPEVPAHLVTGAVTVTSAIPEFLEAEDLLPSIGQVVVGMDGRSVANEGLLETARESQGAIEPAVAVRFHKPSLAARVLRLAVRPEAAFFFLVAGLTVIAFELYALGPGVAGAVGALGVLLGGYGLASLPVAGWALALALLGLLALTADVQRGGPGVLSGLGAILLLVGGLRFSDAGPQLVTAWWAVVLTVLGVGAFYTVGMPTVVRVRSSTPTIGREHLVGRIGTALTDLEPDGVVRVGRARWRAIAHREAGIEAGDAVEVVGVRGVTLRVEPGGTAE